MKNSESMKKARYFTPKGNRIVCDLCPRFCSLKNGQEGYCFARKNIEGTLYAINYGITPSAALDPIEKKPMYHFLPGEMILSTGPNGCNLGCKFCQNWQMSQTKTGGQYISPADLVQAAKAKGSIGVAFTYSEPLIWYEYIIDCASLLQENGLLTVLVSNGYINEQPFNELLPFIDGMNIDLKSFNPDFYTKECYGKLEDVKRTIEIAASSIIVEVTNLVITGKNDSPEEFRELVSFINEISCDIPLHISRYFPNYKTRESATDETVLSRFFKIAKEKLHYVYVGNCMLAEGHDTCCPDCGSLLIRRLGYKTIIENLDGKTCKNCGKEIYGKFMGIP